MCTKPEPATRPIVLVIENFLDSGKQSKPFTFSWLQEHSVRRSYTASAKVDCTQNAFKSDRLAIRKF
jgi:hypothetical protein